MTYKRVSKQITILQEQGYTCKYDKDILNIGFIGDKGCIFEGIQMQVKWKLKQYPFKPPQLIQYTFPVYHPFIKMNGFQCCHVYEDGLDYRPSKTMISYMQFQKQYLQNPYQECDPMNMQAYNEWKKGTWKAHARTKTLEYRYIKQMIEDSQEKRCITSYLLSNLIENCDEDLLYKIIQLIGE